MSEVVENNGDLPATSDGEVTIGEWKRVNPLSILANLGKMIFSAIVPAAFLLFASGWSSDLPGVGMAWIAFGIFAVIAANAIAAWLTWARLRYQVGENDVRVEQGFISRNARAVPYERIQDVSLEQKFLPRLLGLVEIKFETGAGGKEELKLAYVSMEEGENLREAVRALVDGGAPAATATIAADGEGQPELAEADGRTVFAMDNRRLFTFGLFEFSLVIFAVIIGAAQQLEFLLPFDVWDYVEGFFRDGKMFEAGRYIDGMDMIARILGIIYLLATLLVVGLLSGMGKTFLRDWEFRLQRTAKGFRRRRGLITKTDVVMPVHRVQALVVKTGIIRRRFGWHGLSFISLAQDSGKANHDVAPFAKMDEIAPIANEAGFSLPSDDTDWHRASADYYFDRAIIFGLLVSIPAIAMLFGGNPILGTITACLAGLLVLGEYVKWLLVRHALDPAQVISRRGWLAPRLQIANRVKLHSVEISQNFWSRWRGYCTLRFGMAGGRMAFAGLRVDDAKMLRAAALESIAEVDFAKLPR